MPRDTPEYSTKELTRDTLRDFERLFEKHPAPGAFMCCCLYHHGIRYWTASKGPQARAKQAARNRREKRELVENGRSHGILVYSNGEPVGWCQYGSREELPRFDGSRTVRNLDDEVRPTKLWRITCFVVHTLYRKRGVASAALKAALAAIKKRGGGIVEGYPIARWPGPRQYLGTVSMFRKEGFRIVASFGGANVVMRKKI